VVRVALSGRFDEPFLLEVARALETLVGAGTGAVATLA
jgi:hypothetical protein